MVGLESQRKPSLFTFVTCMMSREEGVMVEDYDDDEMEIGKGSRSDQILTT